MVRTRVVAHGRVQGVFYRDTCRREASASGVAGWVRNCPDGTVEAVFEGDADAVRRMVEWAREGPSYARVDRLDEYDEEPAGESAFRIRH
jgi:acylphosphatase